MNRETFLEKIHIRHDIRALSNTLAYYYGNVLRPFTINFFTVSSLSLLAMQFLVHWDNAFSACYCMLWAPYVYKAI